MKTMGIDPGTAITGYCVLEESSGNTPNVITFGCIRTSKKETAEKRLSLIHDELRKLIKEFKPDNIAVERLFFGSNAKTAMSVGQARGVILLAATKAGLNISEYSPQEVKIALTGYGRADKKQIQQMVKRVLGLKVVPKPDDAADALAIALCHINTDSFNSKVRKAS